MEIKKIVRELLEEGNERVTLPSHLKTTLSQIQECDLNDVDGSRKILDEIDQRGCLDRFTNLKWHEVDVLEKDCLKIYVNFMKKLLLLGITERNINFIYFYYSILAQIGLNQDELDYCDFLLTEDQEGHVRNSIAKYLNNMELKIMMSDGYDARSTELDHYRQIINEENLKELNYILKNSYMAILMRLDPAILCMLNNHSKFYPDSFIDKISSSSDPVIIHFLLGFYPKDKLEQYISANVIKNKWFALELIRKILDSPEKECSLEERILGKTILKQLYELNFKFFVKTSEVFSSSQEFNIIFAQFLAELPVDKLEIVLQDTLEVNNTTHYIAQREVLFREFFTNADDEHIKTFVIYFYVEWKKLIDNQSIPEAPFLTELIVTDFFTHVLCYIINEDDHKTILEKTLSTIKNLKKSNTKWYYDSTHFRNGVVALLSYLFLYSYAFMDRKIKNDNPSNEFENLLNIPFLKNIFNDEKLKQSINQIKQNLAWENLSASNLDQTADIDETN